MFKLFKRRLVYWLAIVAIAMSALAPSISQAISVADQGVGLTMEICSVDGQKMTLQVDVGQRDDGHSKNEHCPYCTLHAPVLHTLESGRTFEQTGKNLYPQLFYQSPQPLFAWVSLPSRAPPPLA